MRNKFKAIIATAVLATAGVSCAYATPNSSEFACSYKGGTWDSRQFEKAVPPGSGRTATDYGGTLYYVPTNVRQYDNSDGMPDVTITVGGIPMTFSPSMTFVISSVEVDPDGAEGDEAPRPAGCMLIEKHLGPLDATDFNDDVGESRWISEFLNARVGPAVRDAAPRILQGENPSEIAYNIDGARDNAAELLGAEVQRVLEQQLGAKYFCGPSFDYGGSDEDCGNISVVLSEPTMSDADRAIIAAPERARTEADNQIAAAREEARAANETAAQLEQQATSAERAANARVEIAEQENRVIAEEATNTYAWCAYLTTLGQDCALVRAAENGNFPTVFGDNDAVVAVPAPAEEED